MSSASRFTVMFCAFTAIILISLAFVAFWAYRSRQFTDQDRARYLALRSGPPSDEKAPGKPVAPQQNGEAADADPGEGRDNRDVPS